MLELIIALGAAGAVLIGVLRWSIPRIRSISRTMIAFKDAILGRDAVTHPDTGKEVLPAQPGLGARVASIEVTLSELVRVHHRLDTHDARLERLEQAADERSLARHESIELLRTIDTALRSDSHQEEK